MSPPELADEKGQWVFGMCGYLHTFAARTNSSALWLFSCIWKIKQDPKPDSFRHTYEEFPAVWYTHTACTRDRIWYLELRATYVFAFLRATKQAGRVN